MTIDRRSGAPSTFTWLLGLALGATCAAMTPACSASSGASSPGGWAQSGGGPLGANDQSSGNGDDAASAPSQPVGDSDAAPTTPPDGGAPTDATTDGGGVIDIDAPADAPGDAPGDGGVNGPDFTLVNTTDVLGPSLCPVACSTPPCMMNPPVFLARIAGSLTTGTFESKLYVAFCTSEP